MKSEVKFTLSSISEI